MRRLTLLIILCSTFGQSQPPTPAPAIKSNQPKQPAASRQNQATADERGSKQSPVFIKVLPPEKAYDETADDKTKDLDKSSADWWMVRLTAAIAIIGIIQAIVFGIQAYMLKQTISKMDEIAGGQARDVQASIAEATRAATAMEAVATSMAVNSSSVKESVLISREIADRQKFISELQSRAYLSVEFGSVVPQNIVTGMRFEPRVVITNRGNTPAYKVRLNLRADVIDFPLKDAFQFDLPEIAESGTGGIIAGGTNKTSSAVVPIMYAEKEVERIKTGGEKRLIMWGNVTYEDAFKIPRFVRFGMTFFWLEDGKTIMSADTPRHNDSN
jgi:hypothetical protein